MIDPDEKDRRLAEAERQVSEGTARVTEQVALVEFLRVRGRATYTAETTLRHLRETLAHSIGYRDSLLSHWVEATVRSD